MLNARKLKYKRNSEKCKSFRDFQNDSGRGGWRMVHFKHSLTILDNIVKNENYWTIGPFVRELPSIYWILLKTVISSNWNSNPSC